MPSVRQITSDCLPLKNFIFRHYGLKIRALKTSCVFKSAQCILQCLWTKLASLNIKFETEGYMEKKAKMQ